MANILTIFLLLSTFCTGILWFFYFIKYLIHTFYFKEIHEKYFLKHNKQNIFEKIASFFPCILVIFIVRSFIYEPFQIPSGSMMPTLLVGDFILVEKFSYGIRNPLTNKIFINTKLPRRGEIVVFKNPQNHVNYIKRVIGLPGDKIKYDVKNKKLTICKNYIMQRKCNQQVFIQYSKRKLSNVEQKMYFLNKKNLKFSKKLYNSLYFYTCEENINGIKHKIFILKELHNVKKYYHQKNTPKFTWIVPKKKYFMMGDNRDNSLDSRYWGFVPEENLVGKAIKIWMSFEKNENEWPTGIRFNRIGSIY